MWRKISFLIFLNLCLVINALPSDFNIKALADEKKCGLQSCNQVKPGMINVHLVPHTHDDVGWLKTVDQYYYGSRGNIQKASVQYIIDSVVESLLQDPERKFVYVESAFFTKWWNEQTDELKEEVKMLVNEGRLEFIGGAWVMNDEAGAHYHSIIDQFTLGLKFLNDTFGECAKPRVGWQIDPFGHSREQASLFTKMGFDSIFFARLDSQDKSQRLKDKTMEMVWKSSDNLDDSDILTAALYHHYSPPPGFCFDILCNDEPIIDDVKSEDYNVNERINDFAKYVKEQATQFRSNNVILTMGDDFHFMSAGLWFKNLDKLIKYSNARQSELGINVFYSTPSCYVKALHDANIEWPTKSDDFFPYGSSSDTYWTGYFTSRPTSKRFERQGNQFLQITRQLSSAAKKSENFYGENLQRLSEQMGVMQHHDAITGTEKQHVADDYHRELHASIIDCEANTKSSLNQFVTGKEPTTGNTAWDFNFNSCLNLNISICAVPETSQQFMVTVYNPLAHESNQYVRFPVGGSGYEVRDASDTPVKFQLVPIPTPVKNIPYRTSSATNELVFQATNVPPVGYKSYYVSRVATLADTQNVVKLAAAVTIGNDNLKITFDENGYLSDITVDGATSKLTQNFIIYRGAMNNGRNSGAYVFRPDPNVGEEIVGQAAIDVQVVTGEQVDEVHQVFNKYISQVVRVYKTEKFVEFEWMVGPIEYEDNVGREIVSRFTADIDNAGIFYTDSNGREMMKRTRNFRETWNLDLKEPISGNYYPINTKIAIEDANLRLAVLTDRVEGGSSIHDGSVDLMVHRRLLLDDYFGAGEALNETSYGQGLIARGKHYLLFGKKSTTPKLEGRERLVQNKILLSNWLFFDNLAGKTYDSWKSTYTTSHSLIGTALPENIYLMTYELWRQDSFLIRFEHIMEKNDDPELSKLVTFNLAQVFPGFDFAETALAANQWVEDVDRLHFKQEGAMTTLSDAKPKTLQGYKVLTNPQITLNPMVIRTFIMSPKTGSEVTTPNPTGSTEEPADSTTAHGIKSQTVFKAFPLVILAAILKFFLKL